MSTRIENHQAASSMPGLRLISYASALREALVQEMQQDERVFVFGLDVDDHKGIQGSTLGLVEEFGQSRCFSTPLSEESMMGVAIGAAMAGMRPVFVHIRMDFLLLCMNQLINMGAKMHYMYNGQVEVPLVIRCMVGRSWGQGGQHSQALHSLFMHIPGLKVVAPSNAHDAKGMLITAIRDNNPVVFMEHRLLYAQKSYVKEESYALPLGKARILAAGDDITIVSISHMLLESLRARQRLLEVGVSAEVIDPISLSPLDIKTIAKSVEKTRRLLVVDNAWLTCGTSSEIMTQIVEYFPNGIDGKPIAMSRMGFADVTCPTTRSLENLFYPNDKTIAERAYLMLRGKKHFFSEKEIIKTELSEFKGPF